MLKLHCGLESATPSKPKICTFLPPFNDQGQHSAHYCQRLHSGLMQVRISWCRRHAGTHLSGSEASDGVSHGTEPHHEMVTVKLGASVVDERHQGIRCALNSIAVIHQLRAGVQETNIVQNLWGVLWNFLVRKVQAFRWKQGHTHAYACIKKARLARQKRN